MRFCYCFYFHFSVCLGRRTRKLQKERETMNQRKLLDAIDITNETTVEVPDTEDYRHWTFWEGRNTLSGNHDVFAIAPHDQDDDANVIFRHSGKEGKWHVFRQHIYVSDVDSELDNYDKVQDLCEIEPDFYEVEDIDDEEDDDYECDVQRLNRVAEETGGKTFSEMTRSLGLPQDKPKKGELFMSLKKVFGRFGKAEKGVFAISMDGNIAIRKKDSTYAVLQGETLVNMDTFAMDVDAFYYMPIEPSQLAVNDVVVIGSGVGFVMGIEDSGGIRVYDVNAECIKVIKPSVHFLMKTPFVTKVVSLINMSGDTSGDGAINPLMFLLMGDDIDPLMLMLIDGQGRIGRHRPDVALPAAGQEGWRQKGLAAADVDGRHGWHRRHIWRDESADAHGNDGRRHGRHAPILADVPGRIVQGSRARSCP